VTLYAFGNSATVEGEPLAVVSRGALSSAQEEQVRDSTQVYGMVFNMPDVELMGYGDGSALKARVLHFILELRNTAGLDGLEVPPYTLIKKWYDKIADAPDHVDEIEKGVALERKLKYVGGLGEPEQKPGTKDWWIAGLNFEAVFITRH
jgi:hypothetical protein